MISCFTTTGSRQDLLKRINEGVSLEIYIVLSQKGAQGHQLMNGAVLCCPSGWHCSIGTL